MEVQEEIVHRLLGTMVTEAQSELMERFSVFFKSVILFFLNREHLTLQ